MGAGEGVGGDGSAKRGLRERSASKAVGATCVGKKSRSLRFQRDSAEFAGAEAANGIGDSCNASAHSKCSAVGAAQNRSRDSFVTAHNLLDLVQVGVATFSSQHRDELEGGGGERGQAIERGDGFVQ